MIALASGLAWEARDLTKGTGKTCSNGRS